MSVKILENPAKARRPTPVEGNSALVSNFFRSFKGYNITPLVQLKGLANELNVRNLYMKDENKRFGLNSFKGLGVCYAMSKSIHDNPKIRGFVCATAGNHGEAVAFFGRHFSTKVTIFVPANSSTATRQRYRELGADAIVIDGSYDEAVNAAKLFSEQTGHFLFQDTAFEGYNIIPELITHGYQMAMIELEEQLFRHTVPDVIILSVGVGSWASACINYIISKYDSERPKIICVEPIEADGMLQSILEGQPCSPLGKQDSVMKGLNCGVPSESAYRSIVQSVDWLISFADVYAVEAREKLMKPSRPDPRIDAGLTGAAGLGALLAIKSFDGELKEKMGITPDASILIFNTEGNLHS